MFKLLTPEIKDFTNWNEAKLWLNRHGWGSTLIEEQKLLWDEFKKSGTDSSEMVFDITTNTILLVEPVVVTEPEAAKPVVASLVNNE